MSKLDLKDVGLTEDEADRVLGMQCPVFISDMGMSVFVRCCVRDWHRLWFCPCACYAMASTDRWQPDAMRRAGADVAYLVLSAGQPSADRAQVRAYAIGYTLRARCPVLMSGTGVAQCGNCYELRTRCLVLTLRIVAPGSEEHEEVHGRQGLF